MNRGTTLLELVFVVTVLGTVTGVGIRSAKRAADVAAVRSAREAFVGLVHEARGLAVARGGAGVDVIPPEGGLRLWAGGAGQLRRIQLPTGVEVRVVPRRDTLRFRFDGLGVGRFTSASVVFQRGLSSRGVRVSTYGRVVRR